MAVLFLTLSYVPGALVAAAPQLFAFVGPGVTNIPIPATAFGDPGFGEVADAINVATGNAYVDLGQLTRNNTNTKASTTTNTVVGGATSPNTSLSGSFNVKGVLRLMGFNPTVTAAPQEWAMGVGDGGSQLYRRATSTEIAAAPSWINQRYAGVRATTTSFISKLQTGIETPETWLIQYRLPNGQMVVHYYDHDGNRTTFWRDGQYADYQQTPHEQYWGVAGQPTSDAEGSTAPRTEFTYTAAGNGQLAKVRDYWGRTTTYEWDGNTGTVTAINILLQNENDASTWRRRVEYTYGLLGSQRVVEYMVFRTYNAQNQAIGRWFDLDYKPGANGELLLDKVKRPVLADGSEGQQQGKGWKTTTYTYDAYNRVSSINTLGEPDTTFLYESGSPAGGAKVTVTQNEKQKVYHFTTDNRLRTITVKDINPVFSASATEAPHIRTYGQDFYYSVLNQIRYIKPAKGPPQEFWFDTRGNRTQWVEYLSDGGPILRKTNYDYNADNRLTKETIAATPSHAGRANDLLSETSVAYGTDERRIEYTPFDVANVAGQSFTAVKKIEEKRYLDSSATPRRQFITEIDGLARVTATRLRKGADTSDYRAVTYGYNWSNPEALSNWVPVPDAGGRGDWTSTRMVRSYGDLVYSKTVTGLNIDSQTFVYHYDELGNTTYQYATDAFVGNWDGATPSKRLLVTFEAFDGFGNKVWRRVLSQLGPNISNAWEENKTWTYYATGELKASSEGHPTEGGGVRRLTAYTYDETSTSANFGRVNKVQAGEGSDTTVSTVHHTTDLGYDTYGRAVTSTVDGFTTTLVYDTLDRVVKTTHPDGAYRRVRYHTDGQIHGEIIKDIGSNEVTIYRDVDSASREYAVFYPEGSVRTYYDAFDRPIKITDNRLVMNSSDSDRSTYFNYDTAGNLIRKLDPALVTVGGPYSDARRPYAEYGYDEFDRQTVTGTLMSGATITPQNMSSANGAWAWTTTEYDAFDRPVKKTDADGYDTKLTYDNSSNVTSITREVWNGDEPGKGYVHMGFDGVTTRTAYDGLGRQVQQVDGRGNSKRTTYNPFGVQSQVNELNNVTHVFTYTPDGLLSGVWEPDNNTGTTAQHGSVNVTSPSGTHTRTEYRHYGSRSLPARIYRAHMNTAAGPESGARTDYVYNAQGRPTQTTLPPDQSASIIQTYNHAGKVLSSTDANRFVTTYKYDWAGRLTEKKEHARSGSTTDSQVAGLSNGLVTTYRYDKAGNLSYQNERGLITEYKSNSLGKVISESRPRVGDATSTNWKHRTYRLDGPMTAETSYDYVGSLTTTPDITEPSDTRMTNSAGNITFKWYYARGLQIGEVSYGANKSWEYTRHTFVNGLGNRHFRQFWGNPGIYKPQQYANGAATGYTNYWSLWKFDANSNLLNSWDTPSDAGGEAFLDGNLVQNQFVYTYSPTNKETAQTRNIQVRHRGQVPGNVLTANYGGANGVVLAASVSTSTATYTERDQLEKVVITDQNPTLPAVLINGTPPQQDVIGTTETKSITYSYYQDGQREYAWAGDGTQYGSYRTYKFTEYDQRGRELLVRSTNGAYAEINTTYGIDGTITNSVIRGSEVYRSVITPTVGGLTAKNVTTQDGQTKTNSTVFSNGSTLVGVPYTTTHSSSVTGTPVTTTTNSYNVYGNLIDSQGTHPNSQPEYPVQTQVYQASYNSNGSVASESKFSPIPESPNYQYLTSTYTLDSRGNRLAVSGGEASGYIKRYDADNRVSQFDNRSNNARSTYFCSGAINYQCYGVGNRYNDFRYDPFGQQVLSSTGQIEEQNDPYWYREHGVWRDWSSAHFVNGEIQLILQQAGNFVYKCTGNGTQCQIPSYTYGSLSIRVRDATYSLANGYSDNTVWTGTMPFAIVKASVESLDAPIKPLSSVLNINPLEVTTGSLSSINLPDPSQIKAGDVQAKDAPVKVDPKKPQAVNPAPESKINVQLGVGGLAQAKTEESSSNPVFIQEVSADFNDGLGFKDAIYAYNVQTLYVWNKNKSVLQNLVDWGAETRAAEDEALGKQADAARQEAQQQSKSLAVGLGTVGANSVYEDWTAITSFVEDLPPTLRIQMYKDISEGIRNRQISRDSFKEMAQVSKYGHAMNQYYKYALHMTGTGSRESKPTWKFKSDMASNEMQHAYIDLKVLSNGGRSTLSDILSKMAIDMLSNRTGRYNTGSKYTLPSSSRGRQVMAPIMLEEMNSLGIGCNLNSFAPSTPVRSLSGLVAIGALTIGTPVLAFNEQTGENGYYPITAVHKNIDPDITYLAIQDPEQGNKTEYIETTPEHPFYLSKNVDASHRPAPEGHADLNSNWVGAGHLKIGDKIKQADGTLGTIANVITLQQTQEMFNLTVSEAHTYYVGDQGWLVHNADAPKPLTLYRAVSEGEYQSIVRTGKFQTIYGMGYEGKQFALSYEDALKFAKGMAGIGGDPYTRVVATTVTNPNKISMELGVVSDIDGGLRYALVKDKALNALKPITDINKILATVCP
ncbi:polymorphic toxin-type HINT domain-containing protein [Deinococcus sp. Arct2-2]|uniref:polymorphic toxin-type HINT domain-containing protein n=1 Tax=Deinococcus sp. Arct2-2 TaxID=2568653 RepID=UPI001F0FE6BE|nr:polymorphic toxin-type HINT domain-containing protein [Deinococcus sp. Arct2-2]